MRISLIVTTYNRPDALLLVLKSIQCQSIKPFDVIIADDGSNHQTKDLIVDFALKTQLNLKHSFQEDLGFRAAKSRNKARTELFKKLWCIIHLLSTVHYELFFLV